MRHAVSRPHAPRLLGWFRRSRPAIALAAHADDLGPLAELPARAEALVESAMPYLDRARRRPPERRRGHARLLIVCAALTLVGAAAAWAALHRRRDDEYARLVADHTGPRTSPTASGPSAPAGPGASSPDRNVDPAPEPSEPPRTGQPVRDPITASSGQAARARAQGGPILPATPAPSQYLRSNRTELPPVPGSRPTLPR